MNAAQQYLDAATHPLQKPEPKKWTFKAPFFRHRNRKDGKDRPGQYQHVRKNYHDSGGFLWIRKFTEGVPHKGNYKIRIKATGIDREYPYPEKYVGVPKEDPIRMQVIAGAARYGDLETNNASDRLLAEYELTDNQPEWYEFITWLDAGYQPRIAYPNGPLGTKYLRPKLVRDFPDDFSKFIKNHVPIFVNLHPDYDPRKKEQQLQAELKRRKKLGLPINAFGLGSNINTSAAWAQYHSDYDGPRIRVFEIQIEGPFYETWPPESHRQLFGSTQPTDENAIALIYQFAKRAFRRDVNPETRAILNRLYRTERRKGADPQKALSMTYLSILCSPNFLYLHQKPGELDDFDLASRLSYFLWSEAPDAELTALAKNGELKQKEVLKKQTLRMLNDPRSQAFVHQFTDAWLELNNLGKMLPSQAAHREYFNENLETAMKKETQLFFKDQIKQNRPVTNFIDGKETFINGPLARLYNIDDVTGNEFRKVTITDQRRGGLLGMASVLTATANGIETSPVIRGIWVLENILGTPPSPPPPDVEPLEPDIRGATTIREQLAKHRNVETCNECHKKIDPLGFALESFDEIGNYRTKYFARKKRNPPPVDSSGQLPTGETFNDIVGLKPLLLERSDLLAKNLSRKLLTYATGRHLSVQDKLEAEEIATKKPANQLGFRDLILDIVQSKSFRTN